MKKAMPIFLFLAGALLVVACGDIPTALPPQPGGEPTAPPTAGPKGGWPAEAQPLVDQALNTLTKEAQVSPSSVEVVKVEEVQWPDGCLGCARPGQICTDAIVPGYHIVLRVAGTDYEYRTDKKDRVMLCLKDTAAKKDWGPAQALVDLVVADLSGRLNIPKEQIAVREVLEKEWNDSSLGCPRPGYAYLMVITPGYQIILEAGGQQYDYHTDTRANFVLCEK